MIRSQNKSPNPQMEELERIRMLQTRMRNKGKTAQNQQSLRSIKSTDSKRLLQYKNKIVSLQQKSNSVEMEQSDDKVKFDQQIKNNRKITDYFNIGNNAKKQVTDAYKQQLKQIQKAGPKDMLLTQLGNSNPAKSNMIIEQSLKEQNRNLKEKLRIKEQMFLQFKNKMKKDMLQTIISIHRMQKNQLRLKVSNNKIKLGEYCIQKKGDFWIDGAEIRDVKEKIQAINKQKQELEKNKKLQAKRSNRQYSEDPEQIKNTIAAQMHFLTRQQTHLQETLKRLEQQKLLHIKQYRLLYDEQHSKYGRVDPKMGMALWPKIGQYQLLGLLGKGGFSEVYKAFDTEQLRQVACKLHQLDESWNKSIKDNFVKHAMREQSVHKMLNHSNIVKLYGTVQIDKSAFCTILEYCEGPDLSYYLKKHKRLPEKQAKMVIKQVINAIKYLHELPQKVIHYDLKPQNIMFHKGKIKITDFGLCKITREDTLELTSQGVGTYWYLPPECFEAELKPHITAKVDIWSIGVVYYEMLYGERPFGDRMSQMRILKQGIMLKANSNLINFPNHPRCLVSNQSKDFIKACLKANVEERLDIRQAANHPLFEKR